MRTLDTTRPLTCISGTHIAGLVLARSAMHHSANYRSVVLFSFPQRVQDPDEQYKALEAFTNKMQPGRWDDIRKPSVNEWKATMVVSFPIEEASAKMRTGGPLDDEEDHTIDVWAGVVPLRLQRMAPQPDERLRAGIALPAYLRD